MRQPFFSGPPNERERGRVITSPLVIKSCIARALMRWDDVIWPPLSHAALCIRLAETVSRMLHHCIISWLDMHALARLCDTLATVTVFHCLNDFKLLLEIESLVGEILPEFLTAPLADHPTLSIPIDVIELVNAHKGAVDRPSD